MTIVHVLNVMQYGSLQFTGSLGCSVVHWDALLSVLNMVQCCNCASLGWEIVQLLNMVKYSEKKKEYFPMHGDSLKCTCVKIVHFVISAML